MPLNKRLSFIGAGRMAEAIILGITRAKLFSPKNIFVSDANPERLKYVAQNYKVGAASDNKKAVALSDIVILSIKPQVMNMVLDQIKDCIQEKQFFISIAAGISLSFLENRLLGASIIRVMPNNPCLVGEGMSVLSKGSRTTNNNLKIAEKIFASIGKILVLEEKHLDAVTGLSGSGPAFVYRMAEALIEGGIKAGLSKEVSSLLAVQTALGAIKTLIETGKSPEELCDMVTSPGGTTLAGLKVLDEGMFNQILSGAVQAAANRAKELEARLPTPERSDGGQA